MIRIMQKKEILPLLLLIIFLLFSWQLIGGIFMLAFISFFPSNEIIASYLSVNIPSLTLFIFSIIGTRIVFNCSLNTMISERKHKGGSYLITALITFALIFLSTIISYKNLSLDQHTIKIKLIMLFIVLAITPIQCISEEYLFRVLLSRIINTDKNSSKLLISFISGLLFLFAHMVNNPEFKVSSYFLLSLYYFTFGFLAMYLGIYFSDFTYPIVIHIVNNLYSALIVGYKDSPLKSAPIFISDKIPSPLLSTVTLICIFAFTYHYVKKWELQFIEEN